MAEAAIQQLATELAQARDQILRQATALDQLRAQAQAEIAASEARMRDMLARMTPAPGDGKFDIVDFKASAPNAFNGRREESWKKWSRKFRTYCNARKDGFRAALVWSECAQVEINHHAIDSMGWAPARVADSKLYDFPMTQHRRGCPRACGALRGHGFRSVAPTQQALQSLRGAIRA